MAPDEPDLPLPRDDSQEPPLVFPLEEEEPRPAVVRRAERVRPEPGILMSIVWCTGLLASLYVPLLAVALVAFGVQLALSDNPGQFLQEQRDGFQRIVEFTQTDEKPQGGPPNWPLAVSYSLAAGMLAGHLGSLAYTLVLLRYVTGRDWMRQVAFRRPRVAHLVLAVLVLPGLMLTHSAVHLLLHKLFGIDADIDENGLRSMVEPWGMWWAVLLLGVGPGLIEELFCRGFLARGLVARYGFLVGVLLTSAFFGMLHLAPLYAIGTAVMGLMLHLTYAYTRSLWVPILLHFANNSISVLAVTGGPVPPGAERSADDVSAVSYLLALALSVVGILTMWTARSREVAVDEAGSPDPDREPWRPRYDGVELPPPGAGTVLRSRWPHPLLFVLTCVIFAGLVYSFLPDN